MLMIKIFGKVHYHWQPDLSILVTYWSIAVIPVFIGLALMYESSSVPVSYTHLDVYKRQTKSFPLSMLDFWG